MGTASAAVQTLLSSVGHLQPLDAEIMEYICSVVEDPDPESSLDLLISVLSECVGAFASLCCERQAQLILQLLEDAKLEPDGQDCGAAPSPDDNSIQAVLSALRQATLQCQEQPDACTDITNTHAAAGSRSSSSSRDSSTQKGPDLGPLLELCPAGINSRFLQHCVQHNLQGDLQAAANWLLESDPVQLERQQQQWERDMQQREQEQQEAELQKKRQKKLIVEKFDLRVVSDSSGGSSKKGQAGPDLLQQPKKCQGQESKQRYRDGRVVSTKGEKIIVEKVGEDWDGGSRGKVYTKGKRGKGFH